MNQQNEQNDIVEKWDEFCKMEEENSKETERMVTKKRKMMDEIKNGMTKKDEEIGKLRKENRALKLKMAKMEADLKAQNVPIRRQMPSELSNEMFASMPFGNAFGLLAKMPNGLLARNVLKMINGIKKAVKNNKLDEGNCGTKLIISEDGLETKHLGPAADEWNCVRAIFPITTLNLSIKKPTIAYYYEVQILNLTYCYAIAIGFCDQQFPLEDKWLGMVDNSIGFGYKWGIWIDRNEIRFRNSGFFRKGDFIGIGIIQHPKGKMECFATWNGKLLGKTNLPSKFANLQIYPAIGLRNPDDTVRANFKKEEWKFKHFQSLLE